MHYRCNGRFVRTAHRYVDRGITVCPEWSEFKAFVDDMGVKPSGLTLDRIDNDKGYSKTNCRWVTASEQNTNKERTVMVEFEGETLPLVDVARRVGIDRNVLNTRLHRGLTLAEAINKPIRKRTRKPKCSISQFNSQPAL
jgi:DNA-directed RNA polymerase specialized sigma24 family protein